MPNKPYYLKSGEVQEDMLPVIEEMKREKRKKIIYLGVISADRDLQSFAEAVERVKRTIACICSASSEEMAQKNLRSCAIAIPP